MPFFPLRLPRTLALGSRPRAGPGGARCTGSAPARNSNSGACYAAVLSRPAGLPGVSVLSESELAKYYQLQQVPRDADACAVAVIAAWRTKLRRTSGDLNDLDKLGIDLETSIAAIALATPPVDLVVTFILAPMDALNQLDAAVDFIFALSPTSPRKAGSHNPPPPLSPLLIQLRTVFKMTTYGERLVDDAMGVQGSRARLAGMLAGGVWFRVVGTHGGPQPTGCGYGLYLAPLPHFSQEGWLAQPSPTALSPFDPTSYGL